MIIPSKDVYVGSSVPLRISFLNGLRSFLSSGQTLDATDITWVSQTPSVAAFEVGSDGLVTSEEAASEGLSDDAVIGRFTMLTAGRCTVYVSVGALNPTQTYVSVVQFTVAPIPSP